MDIWLVLGLAVIIAIMIQAFRAKRKTPPQDGSDNWNYDGD